MSMAIYIYKLESTIPGLITSLYPFCFFSHPIKPISSTLGRHMDHVL